MKNTLLVNWLSCILVFTFFSLLNKPTAADLINHTVIYAVTLGLGMLIGSQIKENENKSKSQKP